MHDWTAGYVATVDYTFGYYPELNPLQVELAFLNAGLSVPPSGTACELGFGQGVSANLHAAASVTRWYGTDFNPAHAAFAQTLAGLSRSGAQLFDQSFEAFCSRDDLPDFDCISLHGIWSWISNANRAVIVDFIARKLKVGGVVYISYNTQAGWACMAPMRHLLTEHVQALGAPGQGMLKRIDAALVFVDRLLATDPAYARAQPGVRERMQQLASQNRNYLAHEYFNRDWQPMPFADLHKWLSQAKLSFACSATYLEHLDVLNLSQAQQVFLQEIPDAVLRETVRDLMVNQQFRRDYWVRGARQLNPVEQTEALRKQKIVLLRPRQAVRLKACAQLGEASLAASVYGPILDLLADHQVLSIGQIEAALTEQNISLAQIVQSVMVLIGKGDLSAAAALAVSPAVLGKCARLNSYLLDKSRSSGAVLFLASPVTAGAVPVDRFEQLFLLARSGGAKRPSDWAELAWSTLSCQGLKLLKDGQTLESEAQNLAELKAKSELFNQQQLPILLALGVVK